MSEGGDKFGTTSLAQGYGDLLVPLLFQPFAELVAERMAQFQPLHRILETAAGTGVLTRMLDQVLQSEVQIVATDISQSMIEYGRSKVKGGQVSWQQADAMQLPFSDEEFAAVVCQFGAMFFPDKKNAFREALRVLRRGGHLMLAVWDDWRTMPDTPLAVASEVVGKMLNREPESLVNPKYCDQAVIQRDLSSAGFQDIVIESVLLPTRAYSATDAAVAVVHGSPLVRGPVESSGTISVGEALKAVEDALREKHGSAAHVYQLRALIITARRVG